MQKSMTCRAAIFLCLVFVGFVRPATAQDAPRLQLSAGYNWIAAKDSGDESWQTFPKGWYVDVVGNNSKGVGIAGQISGNQKTVNESGTNVDLNIQTFMVGVRGSQGAGKLRGFGQFLVGVTRLTGSFPGFTASESDKSFQFGAGVNIVGQGRIGGRVGADYTRVIGKADGDVTGGDGPNIFRVSAGVTISVGGK